MTYQEELAQFPDGFLFERPRFFLLATSDCYYIFDATDGEDGLRIAGETLEEVYTGLMEWRWADSSEDPWDFVEEEEYINPIGYFPTYYQRDNGNFGMWAGSKSRNVEIPGKGWMGLLRSWHDRFR